MRIAEVGFPVPLPKGYHYLVPDGMDARAGSRVRAQFGPRVTTGVVLNVFDGTPERALKPLLGLLDARPALSAEGVACARFISRRFGAPIGEALKALAPPFVKSLDEPVEVLPVPQRAEQAKAFELTPGQAASLSRLESLLDARAFKAALLFGVPASGKTEVYMRLIRRAIKDGGQALFLLPEISLTRPFFDEFAASLGAPVALWHSGLTLRERRRTWLAIARGDVKVIVGARSACLLPLKDLRLAVLDEEQDESFKQDSNSPFYHAREVALERAMAFGALCVLGSATPSLEAWAMTKTGAAELLAMPDRVSAVPRPPVTTLPPGKFGEVLSDELVEKMADRLAKGEQSILLVNRRGFSTLTTCGKCRWIDRCADCGVAKITHEVPETGGWILICHHCGGKWPPPEKCGACGDAAIRSGGVGTQRVAAEVKRRLPKARVLRMDRDTVSKEAKLEERVYDKFRARKADVLVGTKLVAKSFHFPEVTLVGVVDADTMLHMPDFRSSERTMQLLAQVAGRAGRADKPGEVLLQTLSPEHEAIKGAAHGDYGAWADAELAARSELAYPPAGGLIRAVLAGPDEARLAEAASAWADALRAALPGADVVGPAPALLRQVRGKFRDHVLVKVPSADAEAALKAARGCPLPSSVKLTLDADPYDML
ncbi:MAG: primosomal protein N' [Elusimicrobiota bacterium]|nr:MAG: primosomal protein N' [Elusimicrobiota bacterium]